MADAPRRAFVVTLQLAIALLVGLPLLAVTQPFVSVLQGAIALLVLLTILGVAFWRSATNLHGHVKAGAAMIVDVLTSQARTHSNRSTDDALARVAEFLPGLGAPAMLRLESDHAAVGKTLAQLNVRGLTGATVLAITRGDLGVVPTAREVLQTGDILALTGTRDAVSAATALLRGAQPEPASQ